MTHWLRQNGYHTRRAGIRANVGCSEEACARLEARLEGFAEHTGQKVSIVGQSRGGVFARALAVKPARTWCEGIVTLGSPVVSQLRIHPLVLAQVGVVSALGTFVKLPGLFTLELPARRLLRALPRRARRPVPRRRRLRRDVLAQRRRGRLALLPGRGRRSSSRSAASHCGMSVNAQVYRELGFALAAFGAADAEAGPRPPRRRRGRSPRPSRRRATRRPCRDPARAAPGRARAAPARSRARSGGASVARPGSGKRGFDLRGGGDAAERGVGVAAVERAVARVEERHVPGRVAGRGDDLERADPLAGLERARRAGLRARVAAAQLALLLAGVERHVLGQQPRVAAGDQHLDAGQLLAPARRASRCGRRARA